MNTSTASRGSPAGDLERLGVAAEGLYESFVEHVPGVLYVAEPGIEGRWLYVSPQIEDLLGWTPEEWMADPTLFARSLHPDDLSVEEEAERPENTMPGDRNTTEYRLTTRDGAVRWFRDEARLVADEDGDPSFWSGVLTDITDQRESEHLLRQSNERARAIIDTAMDVFVTFDGHGTICDWNRAGEDILGWTREEIVGRNLADTLTPSLFGSTYLDTVEKATRTGESQAGRVLQMNAVRRDGVELPVEVTLWRTEEDDGVRFSAFLRDITGRRTPEDLWSVHDAFAHELPLRCSECSARLGLGQTGASVNQR